jgi:hypothetical protein
VHEPASRRTWPVERGGSCSSRPAGLGLGPAVHASRPALNLDAGVQKSAVECTPRQLCSSWAAFFCRGVDLEMGLNTKHEQVGGSADASKTQKHRQVGGC